MENRNQNGNRDPKNDRNRNIQGILQLVGWAVVLTALFFYGSNNMVNSSRQSSSLELEYGEFLRMAEDRELDSVEFDGQEAILILTPSDGYVIRGKEGTSYTKYTDSQGKPRYQYQDAEGNDHSTSIRLFTVRVETKDATMEYLRQCGGEIRILEAYEPPISPVLVVLIQLLPFVIILMGMSFLMSWMAKKGGFGGLGSLGGVGKANAKVYMERSTGVDFTDVAGQDEAKESVTEIIDFLHNPGKYVEIGAKLPKGALLVGPPGTGKTLLAKAVAGEAGVPFFSISGSDFVEMFVGVGASRVRDLFKEASKVAPCIIFIDEIDTIGKSRDNRLGGNDEREQTLNQLLAEMDGFDPTKGIILLAATNRPEVLDQALLRPGRFDRRIVIDRPNLAGRLATLQVHTRNIKLSEDVDLKKVALATAGTVGADLANLVNEAALRAVRKGRKLVIQEDLLAAFELVIAGTEKKGSVLTEFEKKLVAYHEVGHAMVAYRQKNTEPVQKITIVPHTQGSLGYTLLMPEEDKTELRTKDELLAKITVSMGGRAAEEVVMDTMTNGAAQDIQDATNVARNMVAMFGMSEEFGMMALASRRSQYLEGGYGMDVAQDTAAAMDQAVKVILGKCYQTAVEVIRENREDMDKVVAYLLEKETITGGEMVAILEGRDPALVENPYASTPPDGSRESTTESASQADQKGDSLAPTFRIVPQPPRNDGNPAPAPEDTPKADSKGKFPASKVESVPEAAPKAVPDPAWSEASRTFAPETPEPAEKSVHMTAANNPPPVVPVLGSVPDMDTVPDTSLSGAAEASAAEDSTAKAEAAGDSVPEAATTGDSVPEAATTGDSAAEAEPAGDSALEAETAGDSALEAEGAGNSATETEAAGDSAADPDTAEAEADAPDWEADAEEPEDWEDPEDRGESGKPLLPVLENSVKAVVRNMEKVGEKVFGFVKEMSARREEDSNPDEDGDLDEDFDEDLEDDFEDDPDGDLNEDPEDDPTPDPADGAAPDPEADPEGDPAYRTAPNPEATSGADPEGGSVPGNTANRTAESGQPVRKPIPVDESLPFLGMDPDDYWELISNGEDPDNSQSGHTGASDAGSVRHTHKGGRR